MQEATLKWMRNNRSKPDTIILHRYPFLKKEGYDYSIQGNRSMRYTVDLLVVTDKLIGIEFVDGDYYKYGVNPLYKSVVHNEKTYADFFDEFWVCCSIRSFQTAYKELPKSVGIFIYNSDGLFAVVRSAAIKRKNINGNYDLACLLNKREIIQIASPYVDHMQITDRKATLCHYAELIPREVLISFITSKLKKKHSPTL